MPSQAIRRSVQRMAEMRLSFWTDGLPKCKQSGYGNSENKVYIEDGDPYSEHPMEDFCINFCLDGDQTSIYGVFDGHDGSSAARFASQRMPAELSFDQLSGRNSENEVISAFSQAFDAVENSFLESIDPQLAERTQLIEKIPPELNPYEASEEFPDTYNRLEVLEDEIRGGTSCAVALVHKDILYVGNVGNTRVLLCHEDERGILKVRQLSIDHTTTSNEELERLSGLSVDTEKLKGVKFQGGHNLSRCIGNYFLKGGYKESSMLSSAIAEPIIAQPHITSIPLDKSCKVLIIVSEGLYKSLEEATNTSKVNQDIASKVISEMQKQTTLKGVAQTVVDGIVRNHHDMFLTKRNTITNREDMSLLIRNFNYKFPWVYPWDNTSSSGTSNSIESHVNNYTATPETSGKEDTARDFFASTQNFPSMGESPNSIPLQYNSTSTESSKISNPSLRQLTLDDKGCVSPYVNFSVYHDALEDAIQKETLTNAELALLRS